MRPLPSLLPTSLALAAVAAALFAPPPAYGGPQAGDEKPDVVLTLRPGERPLVRLAFPASRLRGAFSAEAAAVARQVEETLRNDLEYSRIFVIQGPDELAALQLTGDPARDGELYRSLGNEVVLETEMEQQGDRLVLEGQVLYLESGQSVLGKRYRGEFPIARRIAHSLADEVVLYFGQRKGVALTSIAFVSDRSAPNEQREIFLMDYDGWNQRPVTAHRSLSLSPDWSPDGGLLAYVTYVRGTPGVFLADLGTGRKQALITDGSLNSSPTFSPDGRRFAFARSTGGNIDVFVANRDGSGLRQLTYSPGIDTNPAWSPSGREIAFTSSRSGSPQIYIVDSEGANLRRISTQGGYNDGAAWNPNGNRLVYASRRDRSFNLALTDLVTLETSYLTAGRSSDETPSFAPDGRKIAFASTRAYGRRRETQIYAVDVDGANLRQLTREGNNQAPAWSGYTP